METAINIGFSCNLLTKSMDMVVLKASSALETEKQLIEALERFWKPDGTPIQNGSLALILEGETLRWALEPSCKALMLELSCRCKAVICCRVSPLQKAKVVQMVRLGLVTIRKLKLTGCYLSLDWRRF
jgi:phospholipid-translocating ATPase